MKKKSCIVLITLTLIIISSLAMITSGQTTNLQLLDSLQVSANGSHITSNIALQNGVTYQIAVSGTYFTVQSDLTQNNQQDAMYGTHDKWRTHYSVSDGLYIDTWSVGSKHWGAYNSDHYYQGSLVGNGSKVSFWIYSSSYSGNSGSLTVQILGSPVAPSSSASTPTPSPTSSSTPSASSTSTPLTSATPTNTSATTSPTPTNSYNSPTPSSTSTQSATMAPSQAIGSPFEGSVAVTVALIVTIIAVALAILVMFRKRK